MGAISTLIDDLLGPAGPLLITGGVGVLLITLAIPFLLKKSDDPFDRLDKSNKNNETGEVETLRVSGGSNKLDRYAAFLEPQDEAEYSTIQLKLLQAGYPSKSAVRTYHFSQFAMGIGGLLFGFILTVLKTSNGQILSTQDRALWILIPALVGYVLPKYWVTRRVESRREEITNGFPDALDMMLTCVEAGQSLDQSILRVSVEIRASYVSLADELTIVTNELKAGKERAQVLRDLAKRAGVPDISSFVTVMIQSATFGTSIAEALRVYAAEMRDKRVMRAEEKANTLPTKMTLATMMLTLPPLLIILIAPSIYGIYLTMTEISF